MKLIGSGRRFLAIPLAAMALLCGAAGALLGVCGPFTDVSDAGFCPFVLEVFTLGITTGTSPTTYDPSSSVSRLQMAAFLSRTVDGVLKRGGRRAALKQFWTPQGTASLAVTTVGGFLVESDGLDVWVAATSVSRVRGSDGRLLETWTGASGGSGVLPAIGRIFVTGQMSPGRLYRIDPSLPAGAVTTVASTLGDGALGIAFDGARIWTANLGTIQVPGTGSISIVTPGATIPWTTTLVAAGFSNPIGALYDGASVWVTDYDAGTLLKLSAAGAILQTVTVGAKPVFPVFDGTNIWIPNNASASVSVVRASNGTVLATLTGNGLTAPFGSAFDGQRVLITNNQVLTTAGDSVSLWKAADLSPMGFFATGAGSGPSGACSDGVNFWISLNNLGQLARF